MRARDEKVVRGAYRHVVYSAQHEVPGVE